MSLREHIRLVHQPAQDIDIAQYYAAAGMEEGTAQSKRAKELIKPWLQGLAVRTVVVAAPSPKKAPLKCGKKS